MVVLVTGAGGGVGEAVARALAWRGARVGLFDADTGALSALERELDYPEAGGKALALVGDVSQMDDLRRAVRALEDAFGPVAALVNCATKEHTAPVWETGEESWTAVRSANLDGAFFATRAVLPSMLARERGAIIYLGSRAAGAGLSAYAASKHGLLGLAAAARSDLAPRGLRVSLILTPAGGAVQPADAAEAVIFALEGDQRTTPALIELAADATGS